MKLTPLGIARTAWGVPLPDWVETLALACGHSSQATVAKELDRSAAVISQVLRKVYPADMARIEERVRGVFMEGRVACPGLGEIATQVCQDWRGKARKLEVGNPLRTRMFRACNACPRYLVMEAAQ
ncbi:MAG: hypothetical protein ACOH2M_22105 [Cypionkella sp.]|jgi:hypothetical protein